MRRISIDELKENTKILKEEISKTDIDIKLWLEELSPKSRLNFPLNEEKKLTTEEHNNRARQWRSFYRENYSELREKMIEMVFQEIENSSDSIRNLNHVLSILIEYFEDGDSSIQRRASELIQKFDIEELVVNLINQMNSNQDMKSYEAFVNLEKLNLNRNKWISKNLNQYSDNIVETMKNSLKRKYERLSPNHYIFGIIDQLSESIPEDISKVQDELTEITNYNTLGYRDYESLMFTYSRCWNSIKKYWKVSNTERLINEICSTAESQYQENDIWVKQYVLPALEIIGKDNDKAQKTIEWINK